MDFRPARADDLEFLWELHRDTMRPYVEAIWGWDETAQRRRFEERFDPAGKQIVQVAGERAGVLDVEYRNDEVFLAVVEIAPSRQGEGLGTRVIRAVIEEADRRPVRLQVLRSNPARSLYERLGFSIEAETDTHFKMVRRPEDSGS